MPRHIQTAFGRYIFRLMHGGPHVNQNGIWLSDLPANIGELVGMGFEQVGIAYHAECSRNRVPFVDRYL